MKTDKKALAQAAAKAQSALDKKLNRLSVSPKARKAVPKPKDPGQWTQS